jgi:hypothetical protein
VHLQSDAWGEAPGDGPVLTLLFLTVGLVHWVYNLYGQREDVASLVAVASCGQATVMLRCCCGHAVVMLRSCCGHAAVMLRSCCGHAAVMLWRHLPAGLQRLLHTLRPQACQRRGGPQPLCRGAAAVLSSGGTQGVTMRSVVHWPKGVQRRGATRSHDSSCMPGEAPPGGGLR